MFLKILLAIVGLILIFNRVTLRFLNPYKLYLIFGKKGSGKSTRLVQLALKYTTSPKYRKRGFVVYSNMPDLAILGARYIDPDNLGDFIPESNSIMLLDEVGMIWDPRDFKAFKPAVRDFFKLQRHYKVIVFMASQSFDVDKKIRDVTDGMFLHTNFLRVFSLGRQIRRKIVLTEAVADRPSQISENLKFTLLSGWSITYIPKYARYFDSHIVPDLPKLPFEFRIECHTKYKPSRSDRRRNACAGVLHYQSFDIAYAPRPHDRSHQRRHVSRLLAAVPSSRISRCLSLLKTRMRTLCRLRS